MRNVDLVAAALIIGLVGPAMAEGPEELAVTPRYVGRVTASYVRAEAPQLIAGLVADVQAGKVPVRELDAFVDPATRERLLASSSTSVRDRLRSRLSQTEPTPWEELLARAWQASRTPPHAPDQLAFPALYESEKAEALLLVTNTSQGLVGAGMAANPNFEIVELRVYDGTLVRDRLGRDGAKVVSRRTAPPWTASARQGQTVGVKVRFAPTFDLFKNPAGAKSATLSVSGRRRSRTGMETTWRLEVPVEARFKGVSLGVIAFPEGSELEVVKPDAYRPDQPQVVRGTVVLINPKEAVSGSLRPEALPPGVTMDPVSVQIGHDETKKVPVTFRIDRSNPNGVWFQPHELPHALVVRADFGGRSSSLHFVMVLYEGFHYWESHGLEVGSCDVSFSFVIRSNGFFEFAGWGTNNDLVFSRQVLFSGTFDGVEYVNAAASADNDDNFHTSYGFHRQIFEDQYTDFIHKAFLMRIRVKHPL